MQSAIDKQPITEESAQLWVNQLEQWTNIFYNNASGHNAALWQEAQAKLVQFQKIHDPFGLCTKIIEKSRNPLVLYQATLCLKNAVANDFKKYDQEELFKLFQFLFEFLCARTLENETSVNETTAFICAMIIKRTAGDQSKFKSMSGMDLVLDHIFPVEKPDKEEDKVIIVIQTLCSQVKDPNADLSKKIASALLLNSLLLECQLTNRSNMLGIRVWKHLNARRLLERNLKTITEVCLETINWAFTSNLLNPANMTRETQVLFYLVMNLIQCVELSLSYNSSDFGCTTGGDRVLRVIQSRTINMLTQIGENNLRFKTIGDFCSFIISPHVVQFLFNLYTTIKSMITCNPNWSWPKDVLKNCLNCLYYLSDVLNSHNIKRDDSYIEFVSNLLSGAVKIIEVEVPGIDDSFQIACLITSISMHTGESRDTITKIKEDCFISFLDASQRFTCKIFTKVAKSTKVDEEEEEEKTVDMLLDFWYHLFKSIESEINYVISTNPDQPPKINNEVLQNYSRIIVESYASCHLHEPLGQVVPKPNTDIRELDLEQTDDQEDNSIYAQQLISFGMISRFDALHTAKILIELLTTRVTHLEAFLTEYISTKSSPEGMKDWEYINDDIHWLLLMLQHYLTQTGYGEIGFMCNEILNASVSYKADVQKTLEGFGKCDYTSPEVDPIVRLIIVTLKLCQMEMEICRSGHIAWLSVQTNSTLTSLLSRFCLTYLYPKESSYSLISENMNYCFGQDSLTADKFIKFVMEHTCCIILYMKSDTEVVKKNVQLLIQLLLFHSNTKDIIAEAEDSSMIKTLVSQLKPENLTGFSPKVAKSIIKLATRLFVEEDDWNKLIDFFTTKWSFIMSSISAQQHQSELVSSKFLEFCDFAIGVCEACDTEISERLFEQLLGPIVDALPGILKVFTNFENVTLAVFELLYNIVKSPMLTTITWQSDTLKLFYVSCKAIIEAYSQIAIARTNRGQEEEDCEDIIALLTFCHEVIKRGWGNIWYSCDDMVRYAMEKISLIVKPEFLNFPRVRCMYYRMLVYLVDEDDRLATLNDNLLNTIVSSILLGLKSQFDKEVDNHTYTIISIICRTIYQDKDKGTPLVKRLSDFMLPVLPALFQNMMSQGSFTINVETTELVAPALFSLRCCFPDMYRSLVKDLIDSQDDPYAHNKVKSLFENLEMKAQKLTLNRSGCREFTTIFVPFLSELHNYVTVK